MALAGGAGNIAGVRMEKALGAYAKTKVFVQETKAGGLKNWPLEENGDARYIPHQPWRSEKIRHFG